jgi:hypothetical protein
MMKRWPIQPLATGVVITYQGMVLRCQRHRDREDNFASCRKALCELVGLDEDILFGRPPCGFSPFDEAGGKVALYREVG